MPMADSSNSQLKMSRFLMVNAVAERAKTLQQGSRPLLDLGGKLKRPLDIALEEIRQGLLKVETSTEPEESPDSSNNGKDNPEGDSDG